MRAINKIWNWIVKNFYTVSAVIVVIFALIMWWDVWTSDNALKFGIAAFGCILLIANGYQLDKYEKTNRDKRYTSDLDKMDGRYGR